MQTKSRWFRRLSLAVALWTLSSTLLVVAPVNGQGTDADAAEFTRLIGVVAEAMQENDAVKALEAAESALEILERRNGPDHPTTVNLRNTVETLRSLQPEQFTEILRLRDEAAALARGHDYGGAIDTMLRVLELSSNIQSYPATRHAYDLRVLGGYYLLAGDYEPGYTNLAAAYEAAQTLLEPDSSEIIDFVIALAKAQRLRGEHPAALSLYRQAVDATRAAEPPNPTGLAELLNELGMVYQDLRQFQRARDVLEEAIGVGRQAAQPDERKLAAATQNLGEVLMDQREYGAAERRFREALEIKQSGAEPDELSLAISLSSLGSALTRQGKHDEAATVMARALEIRRRELGDDDPALVPSLSNAAGIRLAQGDYAGAKAQYLEALEIMRKRLAPDHIDFVTLYDNLAVVSERLGDIDAAIDWQRRANDVSDIHIDRTLIAGSEDEKRFYLGSYGNQFYATLSLHVQRAPDDLEARELAATTVLRRKGRLRDAVAANIAGLRRLDAPDATALIDDLDRTRADYARQVVSGAHEDDLARVRQRLTDIEESIGEVAAERTAVAEAVTLSQVQAAIPENAALIDIAFYWAQGVPETGEARARYVAYILTRKRLDHVDLGQFRTIDDRTPELRNRLKDRSDVTFRDLSRASYDLVMAPILERVSGVDTLLIAPDAGLVFLPFAALLDEQNRFLIERFNIVYLSSGRQVLRAARHRREPRAKPLIVAAPEFGPSDVVVAEEERGLSLFPSFASMRFRPLPGTREEGEVLAERIPDAALLTGADADEAALKGVRGPQILHIATHGFWVQDALVTDIGDRGVYATAGDSAEPWRGSVSEGMLRSGLALAGANQRTGAEDGILTALELASLDLSGTSLAVLSACETGIGFGYGGDGVYGLKRALALAGAESQILSQWKVADEATRDLMIALYEQLLAGAPRSAALRSAQLKLLRSDAYRHPYYWAAFSLFGDWGPLAL